MGLVAKKLPFLVGGRREEREMHGVGMCAREKKLPSLHNNAMYVHPRLVSVCV